jgi:hypothetical protein
VCRSHGGPLRDLTYATPRKVGLLVRCPCVVKELPVVSLSVRSLARIRRSRRCAWRAGITFGAGTADWTLRSTQEFPHLLVLLEAVKNVVAGCRGQRAPRSQGPQNQKPDEEVLYRTVCDRHLRYLFIVSRLGVREHVHAASDLPAQVNARRFIACRQYVHRRAGEVSASSEPQDRCKNGAAHL